MALGLRERYSAYVEPLWYLGLGLYGLLITTVRLLTHDPPALLHVSIVKHAVFAEFWRRVGPMFEENEGNTTVPALASRASGVVLELGPGTGSQLKYFDRSKITKIYGVEPNAVLHAALLERIKANGLVDIYEIVPFGIEDTAALEKHGITRGSVDTVLSVQVLCSVPRLDSTLRRLHGLMKPGGTLIVYEHVRSTDWITARVQDMYTIFWPFFVGNCHLNCDIRKSIMHAGDWENVDLIFPKPAEAWTLFPRIWGHLSKK